MNILIKYLSLEAIENTATCINYDINKVIFFGIDKVIAEEKKNISSFLSNYCNCESEFISLDNKTFEEIENEVKEKVVDNTYFDFTGDEGIFEGVSFKVANDLNIPVHTFDVWNKKTIVINKNTDGDCILDIKRDKEVKLTISSYIEMIGGKVTKRCGYKHEINQYLIKLRKEYGDLWTTFSSMLGECKVKNERYFECRNIDKLVRDFKYKVSKEKLLSTIKQLSENEIIELDDKGGNYFSFGSEKYCDLLSDPGAILEQIVYKETKDKCDECAVGLSFSWDLDNEHDYAVKNEVDVVCLKDYLLAFISCKDTDINNNFIYELETVGRGFVGNYINMKLVTTRRPTPYLIERGKELGIKVVYQKL